MGKIIAPIDRVWTQQPQNIVGINWSNPLTEGLVSAFVNGLDVCTGTPTGVASGIVTKEGTTWRNYTAKYNSVLDVADITLIGHFYVTSNQGNYAGITAGSYTGPSDSQDISIGLDAAMNRMYATNRHNTGGETYFDSFSNFPYEAVWAIEGSLGPGITANLYKNGSHFGTVPPTGSAAFRKTAANAASAFTSGTSVSGAWVFRFARRLSAIEIANISINPWQLFQSSNNYTPLTKLPKRNI